MSKVAVLNLASASVSFALAMVSWRRARVRAARQLALVALAVGWWTALEAVIVLSAGLDAKLAWLNVQYLGMGVSAPLFLAFAVAYSGREGRIVRGVQWGVWPACIATIVLVWTNRLHGLMWTSVALDPSGTLLVFERGPWFWVYVTAAYASLLAGAATVGSLVMRGSNRLRAQAAVVFVASLLPWAGNILYVVRVLHLPGLDPTPISFSLTGLLLGFATLRLGFLSLVPIARGAVVETMSDGVFVLDGSGRLIDLNPAASGLAGIEPDALTRSPPPQLPASIQAVLSADGGLGELTLEVAGKSRTLELRASALRTRRGKPLGRVVVLRDITERREAEEERERLFGDLRKARDEIHTLQGLLPICSSCKRIRDDGGYWNQIETYIGAHADVRFSHGLCPDCARRLYPEVFGQVDESPKPPG